MNIPSSQDRQSHRLLDDEEWASNICLAKVRVCFDSTVAEEGIIAGLPSSHSHSHLDSNAALNILG
jgi:hypothetical protein